ncbi:hypothetical protein ACFOLJ_13435 [Rugamonas sp. CCM 8940]|uniref:hypothetical protein n=1 Tax=Rugamonas sp. CCM 8940 TaxID=2765359 RepID=UPI001F35962B|nr:hypothetical protein [Rugamonas sp. CCM 8940]
MLVVALLHLLAIYFVTRPRMQSAPVVAARRSEIVFLTSPAPRRTAAPTQRPTPKPTLTLTPISAGANQRPPVAASSAREPAQRPPQPITLVAPATEAPPVANSPAPVEPDWTQPVARQGADSLAERAKKSVGAIDRDLRNKSLNMSDRKPAAEQTALARNVASAFKTQNTTIEEILMADGRRMSKIHTPHGSYCAYMESNAITGGRDPFKDGVRTKISNCTR